MKKTKLFSVLCLVLSAVLLLCACGGGAAPSSPAQSTDNSATQGAAQGAADKDGGAPDSKAAVGGPYKIGVILTSTSNGYGLTVKKHLDNLGKAFNCEFQYTAAREPEEVIAAIESFVSAGVNGIINGVTVSAPVELDICAKSNVYLAIAGNIISDPEAYAQIKDSPYYVGAVGNVDSASTYDMVTYLVKSRGVKKLALVNLPAGTSNMHDGRYEGIIQAVKDNPEVTLVAESRTGNLTEGVQNIVAQYPDIDALIACAGGIEECMQPIISAGKAGKILFGGFREEPGAEALFDDGTLAALGVGTSILPVFGFINLYNAFTGNMLIPAEGERMNIELPTIIVKDKQEYLDYVAAMMESEPYTLDEYKALMPAFNPNVKYADFEAFMKAYSMDSLRKSLGK